MEAQRTAEQRGTATVRKRLPRAERERQILGVAERMFAEQGYQAASMDDIAHHVGVSKPMLYAYFGSKEGLLLACLERAKRDLLDSTTVAVDNATTPERKLYLGLLAFFQFSDEHAQAWALLRNEAALESVDSGLEAIREQQVGFTAEMMRQVGLSGDPVRLEAFAESIIGACERLALWRERRPEITPEIAATHLMALISPGLVSLAELG